MDQRYYDSEIAKIWNPLNKFQHWLKVELAIIQARVNLGKLSQKIFQSIVARVKVTDQTVEEIELIESKTGHDLASFVTAIQNQLPAEEKQYIHSGGVTSYDTEEPALSLMLLVSANRIISLLLNLVNVLYDKAQKYKYLPMIAHTHSQHAQVYTLGIKLLGYCDDVSRSVKRIEIAVEEIRYSKISGAIGTYGNGLSPEIEREALEILLLKASAFSRQITLRDRIANLLSSMTMAGAIIEKIATDFRHTASSERCELQEPFKKSQKGSSVMPFKRNPIGCEKVSGMARLLRGYLSCAIENIATWEERDISHSSVERIILPDSFHTLAHMITTITKIVSGMVINEKRIQRNIELTLGTAISPMINEMNQKYGMDPDDSYYILQELAFQSFDTDESFIDLVLKDERIPKEVRDQDTLKALYIKYYKEVPPFVDEIFSKLK